MSNQRWNVKILNSFNLSRKPIRSQVLTLVVKQAFLRRRKIAVIAMFKAFFWVAKRWKYFTLVYSRVQCLLLHLKWFVFQLDVEVRFANFLGLWTRLADEVNFVSILLVFRLGQLSFVFKAYLEASLLNRMAQKGICFVFWQVGLFNLHFRRWSWLTRCASISLAYLVGSAWLRKDIRYFYRLT